MLHKTRHVSQINHKLCLNSKHLSCEITSENLVLMTYLSLSETMTSQLDYSKVSLADGFLYIVKSDPYRSPFVSDFGIHLHGKDLKL
jgi:hypothetical protein